LILLNYVFTDILLVRVLWVGNGYIKAGRTQSRVVFSVQCSFNNHLHDTETSLTLNNTVCSNLERSSPNFTRIFVLSWFSLFFYWLLFFKTPLTLHDTGNSFSFLYIIDYIISTSILDYSQVLYNIVPNLQLYFLYTLSIVNIILLILNMYNDVEACITRPHHYFDRRLSIET